MAVPKNIKSGKIKIKHNKLRKQHLPLTICKLLYFLIILSNFYFRKRVNIEETSFLAKAGIYIPTPEEVGLPDQQDYDNLPPEHDLVEAHSGAFPGHFYVRRPDRGFGWWLRPLIQKLSSKNNYLIKQHANTVPLAQSQPKPNPFDSSTDNPIRVDVHPPPNPTTKKPLVEIKPSQFSTRALSKSVAAPPPLKPKKLMFQSEVVPPRKEISVPILPGNEKPLVVVEEVELVAPSELLHKFDDLKKRQRECTLTFNKRLTQIEKEMREWMTLTKEELEKPSHMEEMLNAKIEALKIKNTKYKVELGVLKSRFESFQNSTEDRFKTLANQIGQLADSEVTVEYESEADNSTNTQASTPRSPALDDD